MHFKILTNQSVHWLFLERWMRMAAGSAHTLHTSTTVKQFPFIYMCDYRWNDESQSIIMLEWCASHHHTGVVTVVGALMTDTLYPYWKVPPTQAAKAASTRVLGGNCGHRFRGQKKKKHQHENNRTKVWFRVLSRTSQAPRTPTAPEQDSFWCHAKKVTDNFLIFFGLKSGS